MLACGLGRRLADVPHPIREVDQEARDEGPLGILPAELPPCHPLTRSREHLHTAIYNDSVRDKSPLLLLDLHGPAECPVLDPLRLPELRTPHHARDARPDLAVGL